MKILVTGSAGHLGEGLVRTLRELGHEVIGTDLLPSEYTGPLGSIGDRDHVRACLQGVEAVLHTATLHKPHVATHTRQQFVDTNISGTLNLLEAAVEAGVKSFIFTSSTSVFGAALTPADQDPAAWITEDVPPIPKNIYGVTKAAAENLCELFHRKFQLPCIVLRTSRFFPEADDRAEVRAAYQDQNIKLNEFLYRRVDIQDVVGAHLLAMQRAPEIGFGRYIISATSPFTRDDLPELRHAAPAVLAKRVPAYPEIYARLGWKMFPDIDRIYVNERARQELGWQPQYNFAMLLGQLAADRDPRSPLARVIGSRGYHANRFEDGPYPVE